MPAREQILELNSEHIDLQRIGISDASDVTTVLIAGDTLAPAAPSGETANSAVGGAKIEWINPSLNADGTACTDQRWAFIYYSTTSPVDITSDSSYVIAAKAGTNSAYTDTNVTIGDTMYYKITAVDGNSNESLPSGEVSANGGGSGTLTDIPDDADTYVFDDSFETEGVGAGDGVIGIIFQIPQSTWSNFDRYRLWRAINSGSGFGAWAEIEPINSTAYMDKGLNTSYYYKYKATIVGGETESTDADYATNNGNGGDGGAGYRPNQTNNSVLDGTVLVGNLVSANEVRGEHFYAQSYLAINDPTFGNDGIQLEYNGGNPRAYVGDGASAYWNFSGTELTWKAAHSELDASGNLIATSVDLTGAITASSGSIGSFTIGTYLYTGTKTAYNDANAGVHLGSDGIGIGNNVFTVSSAGALVATSATITGAITASSGSIGGFTIGASALTAGTGATAVGMAPGAYPFYAGNVTAASAPFRVTSAGALVATSATITGAITASSGTIGGFTVDSTEGLYAGAVATRIQMKVGTGLWLGATAFAGAPFKVSPAGAVTCSNITVTGGVVGGFTPDAVEGIYVGAGVTRVQMKPGAGIWCGATAIGDAPFNVTNAGVLTATSATITGAITASSGTVGSFTIGTYLYTGSKTAYNDVNAGVHLGSDGLGIGDNVFTVSAAGALVATSGTIGGFTINSADGLYSGTGAARVQMSVGSGFWAGATVIGDAPFNVTTAGTLTANDIIAKGSFASAVSGTARIEIGNTAGYLEVMDSSNITRIDANYLGFTTYASDGTTILAFIPTVTGTTYATSAYFAHNQVSIKNSLVVGTVSENNPSEALYVSGNQYLSGALAFGSGTTAGVLVVGDHGGAALDQVVNVCYGTGSPPAASSTTIGALFVKYIA